MACSISVVSSEFSESDWGIAQEEAGFTATTSVTVTERAEKAEGKDSKGCVVAVIYYNKTSEVVVEGIGENAQAAGSQMTLTTSVDNGTVYVEESTVTYTNDDWVKTSVKGIAYENIN